MRQQVGAFWPSAQSGPEKIPEPLRLLLLLLTLRRRLVRVWLFLFAFALVVRGFSPALLFLLRGSSLFRATVLLGALGPFGPV
jgi:hypothetical protein